MWQASGAARHALREKKGRPVQHSVNRATAGCLAYPKDTVEKTRDQKKHAENLRATLIVGPAIGVV